MKRGALTLAVLVLGLLAFVSTAFGANDPKDNDTHVQLLAINEKLFTLCKYGEIQPAVTASHNNDRVVIMPGLYTEPVVARWRARLPRLRTARADGLNHQTLLMTDAGARLAAELLSEMCPDV